MTHANNTPYSIYEGIILPSVQLNINNCTRLISYIIVMQIWNSRDSCDRTNMRLLFLETLNVLLLDLGDDMLYVRILSYCQNFTALKFNYSLTQEDFWIIKFVFLTLT
jgi:hypothetical protein